MPEFGIMNVVVQLVLVYNAVASAVPAAAPWNVKNTTASKATIPHLWNGSSITYGASDIDYKYVEHSTPLQSQDSIVNQTVSLSTSRVYLTKNELRQLLKGRWIRSPPT